MACTQNSILVPARRGKIVTREDLMIKFFPRVPSKGEANSLNKAKD